MDHVTYQSFNPLQNLKGFVISRPPILVFFVCLITFAVTAFSFAYFVRRSDLKNPDVELDWNGLLENFAKVEFCIRHEGNSSGVKPVATSDHDFSVNKEVQLADVNDVNLQSSDAGSNRTLSVAVLLNFSAEIKVLARNISAITGDVCGRFLGLAGEHANVEYRVTMEMPTIREFDHCDWQHGCQPSQPTCITFHGLPEIPGTQKMKSCPSLEHNASQTMANMTSFSVAQCPSGSWFSDSSEFICHGSVFHVIYKGNHDWTVLLSEHDRTLINQHLMYTSYFLLFMAMTLVCYAMIRGRSKTKVNLFYELHTKTFK